MTGADRLSAASAAALRFVEPILAVVFPEDCALCGASLGRPTLGPLCPGCWQALPRHGGRLCTCGLPLGGSADACGRCRRGLCPFAAGRSLGPYSGALRTLIHELKFRGRRRVADHLADALLADPALDRLLGGADVLVPVPLHPRRRRERGFNQAELLARALARRGGPACVPEALVRRKETAPQSGLSAAARRRNVAGAFAVRRRAAVAGRIVVLVDDVFTTGAPAAACTRALLKAGAREVRLVTVARVA
jgi:ComF family protein